MADPEIDPSDNDFSVLHYDFKAHFERLIPPLRFQQLCQQEFSYLIEDYGFHAQTKKDAGDEDYIPDIYRGYEINFLNSKISIECSLNFLECNPFVFLRDISPKNDQSRGFAIGYFLRFLHSTSSITPIKKIPLDNDVIEMRIKEYAESLKPLMPDIVKGGSSLFSQIGKIQAEEYERERRLFPERFLPS